MTSGGRKRGRAGRTSRSQRPPGTQPRPRAALTAAGPPLRVVGSHVWAAVLEPGARRAPLAPGVNCSPCAAPGRAPRRTSRARFLHAARPQGWRPRRVPTLSPRHPGGALQSRSLSLLSPRRCPKPTALPSQRSWEQLYGTAISKAGDQTHHAAISQWLGAAPQHCHPKNGGAAP